MAQFGWRQRFRRRCSGSFPISQITISSSPRRRSKADRNDSMQVEKKADTSAVICVEDVVPDLFTMISAHEMCVINTELRKRDLPL